MCCIVIVLVSTVTPAAQGLIQLAGSGRWAKPAHQKDLDDSAAETRFALYDTTTGFFIDYRGNRARKRHDLTEPFPNWDEAEEYRNKLCRGRLSCDGVST